MPQRKGALCRGLKATRHALCRGFRGKLTETILYFYNLAIYTYIHQPAKLWRAPLHSSARLALGFRALSAWFSQASPRHLALGASIFGQLDMDVEVCFG